jgi:tetratricopeptide (TPR) repeat protein
MKKAISDLIALVAAEVAKPGLRDFSQEIWRRVIEGCASANEVAGVWQAALNADSSATWFSPRSRSLTLVALTRMFEHLRAHNYLSLKDAFGRLRTNSGRPLSVGGTRSELVSRTAEALFREGRRSPSERTSYLMMSISEKLLVVALTDCFQKDNPQFAKRWYGMRGVCRLMLAVQSMNEPRERRRELFASAAADLERSFELGNRGASAVTYLLDSLLHVCESDQNDATFARFEAIITSLQEDEKRNRGVLALLGTYWFRRSFSTKDQTESLCTAIHLLDESLTHPPFLAYDDAFVRLIRGQVLVRLSMAIEESAPETSMAKLTDGITDLKFSFESSPEKYGKQVSLPSALISRANKYSSSREYERARHDLRYVLDHVELRDADAALRSQAEFKLLLIELLQGLSSGDMGGIEISLAPVIQHPECPTQGALIAALAASKVFANKSYVDDPTLLVNTIRVLETVDIAGFADAAIRRTYFSRLASLLLLLGTTWQPQALVAAFDKYAEAIATCSEPPAAELLAHYGDCALRLAKNTLRDGSEIAQVGEMLEEAGNALLHAAEMAEQHPDEVHESFKLAVAYSKAGESFLRLCGLSGTAEDAEKAIKCFEKARGLGNESHELLGLLGDVYYRLSRIRRRPDLLQHAMEYKRKARDAGATSRENFSLSARLAFMEWESVGNQRAFLSALTLVSQAHEASPDWPERVNRFETAALLN